MSSQRPYFSTIWPVGSEEKCYIIWALRKSVLSENCPEEWDDTPIALGIQGLGKLSDFVKIKKTLSRLNLRIYLPAYKGSECAEIRILSSLGFHCCGVIEPSRGDVDWNALKELAIYALYARRPHGEIYPFSFIANITMAEAS